MKLALNTLDVRVVEELKSLASRAHSELRRRVETTADEVAALYETQSEDYGVRLIRAIKDAGSIPVGSFNDPEAVIWDDLVDERPATLANLFLSRLLTVVSALVPGTPTMEVVPRTAGAAIMADNQNTISEFACDHGGLEEAMARAALLGMLQPYFGVFLNVKPDATHPVDRVCFEAVEADRCGYEPHLKRFFWRTCLKEWAELPEDVQGRYLAEHNQDPPPDWQIFEVIEVYHPGFRHGMDGIRDLPDNECPVSYWIHPVEDSKAYERRKSLYWGTYCGTRVLPANPLHIDAFLQPAPNATCGPAEVVSWIPLMRQIDEVLMQIQHFYETHNNVTLFQGGAISREQIQGLLDARGGKRVYIEVQADDSDRGVNATMRPVEMDSILSELLATLEMLMALFDDVTGVTPSDRGIAQNPEKSATEASAITQNSSRRNKARLEVVARAFGRMARAHHWYQRHIYGKSLELPTGSGLTTSLIVPDPKFANFAFRVDAVDLEHISRRGQIESHITFMREATQTLANFRGAIPPVIRELLRRVGRALDFKDIDLYLQQPSTELGPQERLIEYLMKGSPEAALPSFETDDSELFLSYYQGLLQDQQVVESMDSRLVERLMEAVRFYEKSGRRAQQAQLARMADGSRVAPDQGVVGPAAAPVPTPGVAPRG